MSIRKPTSHKGFTLIELLTVIAIIGILASILIPTIGGVMVTAHKATASNNCGQIAKAFIGYATGGSNSRTIASTKQNTGTRESGVAANINDVAYILAKFAQLTEPTVWFIKQDPQLVGATIPKSVISGDINSSTNVDPGFEKTSPKAWAFVTGLNPNAPSTSTPLLWTYGLQHTGAWSSNSPWGAGGHIAYLDGHVEWADKLDKNGGGVCFTGYQSLGGSIAGQPQLDYMNAINPKAVVVNADGQGN